MRGDFELISSGFVVDNLIIEVFYGFGERGNIVENKILCDVANAYGISVI